MRCLGECSAGPTSRTVAVLQNGGENGGCLVGEKAKYMPSRPVLGRWAEKVPDGDGKYCCVVGEAMKGWELFSLVRSKRHRYTDNSYAKRRR